MKPKKSQPQTPNKTQERDFFQTPRYAVDLLVPYLKTDLKIWECASGHGAIVNRLTEKGFDDVFGTDLMDGVNFFEYEPHVLFGQIVTNPPFSIKRRFYDECVRRDVPFALLIPMDFCGWILDAMKNNGMQWIAPTRRIDYITPTGKQGDESKAQYHSGWFCKGLNLPQQITIVELTKAMKKNI